MDKRNRLKELFQGFMLGILMVIPVAIIIVLVGKK